MILRSVDNFYARPLFYDVVSGEFTPPSDSQNRKHTLGRLAYAGFTKGDIDIREETDPKHLLYLYRPSWAAHVLVTVECDFDEKGGAQTTLRGILLDADGEPNLYIRDGENDDGHQIVSISSGTGNAEFPLRLGKELTTARLALTSAAQDFFEAVG